MHHRTVVYKITIKDIFHRSGPGSKVSRSLHTHTHVSVRPKARSSMSCSSSVRGSGIFSNHSWSTTRWQVEQERVPSHAPVGEGGKEGGSRGEMVMGFHEKGVITHKQKPVLFADFTNYALRCCTIYLPVHYNNTIGK